MGNRSERIEGLPGARLVARAGILDGVEGSSTWRGIARDRLLGLPETWLPVSDGELVEFLGDGPPPDEAFLTIYPAAAVADGSMAATAGQELDPRRLTWTVELPAGRFVLTLSRTWSTSESVSHAFGVERHEPSHD